MNVFLFILYILIMLFSMFFVAAAVGAVTAGFVVQLFGLNDLFGVQTGIIVCALLFIICGVLLWLGKYSSLDKGIKVLGAFLLVSTLVAFALVLLKPPVSSSLYDQMFFFPRNNEQWFFLLALMGWMPTAVDLSAWNSLWTIEKHKTIHQKPSLKATLFDFRFGYLISSLLALCFLTLGAKLLYDSGTKIPDNASHFAAEIVNLYSSVIGQWSEVVIGIAACSIMLGTCIAVVDGYARSVEEVLVVSGQPTQPKRQAYKLGLGITIIGAFAIVLVLSKSLKSLVDIATCISFLFAPIIAISNYLLVTSKALKKEEQPGLALRIWSVTGIIFLSAFSLIFMYVRFVKEML